MWKVSKGKLPLVLTGLSVAAVACVSNGLVHGQVEHWFLGVTAVIGSVGGALHVWPPNTPGSQFGQTAPFPGADPGTVPTSIPGV